MHTYYHLKPFPILYIQVVRSYVRWDGSDPAALSAQFTKELEKERTLCKIILCTYVLNIYIYIYGINMYHR